MDAHVILITTCIIPSGEIDRCLKKVQEGVESFEDIWQKVSKIIFFYVLCIVVLYWLHKSTN